MASDRAPGVMGRDRASAAPEGEADSGIRADAVRAQVAKILESKLFARSERLSRFLEYVVEQTLEGRAGELKEHVLAIEIFGRDGSYDPHVDSVVRVQAGRLREKLERYYRTEGRADSIVIEFHKGSYVPTIRAASAESWTRKEAAPPGQGSMEPAGAGRRRFGNFWVAAAAATLMSVAAVMWRSGATSDPNEGLPGAPLLTRITSDPGLTFQPAVSPDGALLAFSSDRAGEGHLDIWVRPFRGDRAIRLTRDPADDHSPAFSPDGSQIAFRSERYGGGIYVVSAVGGPETLIAKHGRGPRYSPDGNWIVYWTGKLRHGRNRLFVVDRAGRRARQLRPEFLSAGHPIWFGTKGRILFEGSRSERAEDWDWWITALSGGPPVRTGAAAVFRRQGLRPPQGEWHIVPGDSRPGAGKVYFAAALGDSTNIWELSISESTGRVEEPARVVVAGTGRYEFPHVTGNGRILFASLRKNADIWRVPLEADRGRTKGRAERLTEDPTDSVRPSVTPDGTRMAYLSDRTGNSDVWVRDLKTGEEWNITRTRHNENAPVLSPDGTRVAFLVYEEPDSPRRPVYIVPAAGGPPLRQWADCGEPRSWSSDGRLILFQRYGKPVTTVGILDVESGETVESIHDPEADLTSAQFSPDGRWIAFLARAPGRSDRIMAAPFRGGKVGPREEWLALVDDGSWVDKPRWSPDGNLIYFLSDRDGFICVWARRLDPKTKRPLNRPPIPVYHFHRKQAMVTAIPSAELRVARGNLVIELRATLGNIWAMQAAAAPGLAVNAP